MSLDALLYEPFHDGLETAICPIQWNGEIDKDSLLAAKKAEIERTEARLQRFMANPEIGYDVINATRSRIEYMKQEATELAGGEPPRRPPGGSVGYSPSDYTKEIANVRAYFAKAVRREVLKTKQDEMHAAFGLRLLNSMGKKLDNYEIHVPADYRLELLKRAGRFCEEANIFERLAQGKIQMFRPREQLDGGFIFRVTPSDIKTVFGKGFTREDNNYPTTHAHVHEFVYGAGDSYISTSTTTQILEKMHFRERKKDGIGLTPERLQEQPRYLYIINPRAWTGIDVMESQETYDQPPPPGQESRPFLQREVA
jgi:hypothetical protein